MRDIWNPWHGCKKYSEGCSNCYMYYLDRIHNENKDSSIVTLTGNIKYPLSKFKSGEYKVKPGEHIRVCMTSDFCLEEADEWRDIAWECMRKRKDVIFYILTKRASRLEKCLPRDWGDGWENVSLNVTCENQERADERIPILFDIPSKHRGIMCAPILSSIHIEKYLETKKIEQILVGGENYENARISKYEWYKDLTRQAEEYKTNLCVVDIGSNFYKDGKRISTEKTNNEEIAYFLNLNRKFYDIDYILKDENGNILDKSVLAKPMYNEFKCKYCSSRMICAGCSECGKCKNVKLVSKEKLDYFDEIYFEKEKRKDEK